MKPQRVVLSFWDAFTYQVGFYMIDVCLPHSSHILKLKKEKLLQL